MLQQRTYTWRSEAMYRKIGISILFIALLAAGVVAIPPLPYEFYGAVTVNETLAPVGTVIVAKINGDEIGTITTTEPGVYGGPGTFDRRLVVNGAEEQIGEYITFWINDQQAAQKVRLYAGESQQLDLTFIPGEEGSVDASVTPSQSGTVAGVDTSGATPQPAPTQAPLLIAPFAAGLALLVLARKD